MVSSRTLEGLNNVARSFGAFSTPADGVSNASFSSRISSPFQGIDAGLEREVGLRNRGGAVLTGLATKKGLFDVQAKSLVVPEVGFKMDVEADLHALQLESTEVDDPNPLDLVSNVADGCTVVCLDKSTPYCLGKIGKSGKFCLLSEQECTVVNHKKKVEPVFGSFYLVNSAAQALPAPTFLASEVESSAVWARYKDERLSPEGWASVKQLLTHTITWLISRMPWNLKRVTSLLRPPRRFSLLRLGRS